MNNTNHPSRRTRLFAWLRQPSYLAVAVMAVALFAISGSATAGAKLLTGKNFKDNSLTNKDVKNESITAQDVNPAATPAGPQGPEGPGGPSGPTGPAGERGERGSAGPIGDPGPIGAPGLPGEPGAQGSTGAAGPLGPVGPMGNAGPLGDTGPLGFTGLQGPAGFQGSKGPVGPGGITGPKGPTGYTGETGNRGPAGKDAFGALSFWRGTRVTTTGAGYAIATCANSGTRPVAGAFETEPGIIPISQSLGDFNEDGQPDSIAYTFANIPGDTALGFVPYVQCVPASSWSAASLTLMASPLADSELVTHDDLKQRVEQLEPEVKNMTAAYQEGR